jgi:hypothetical protein
MFAFEFNLRATAGPAGNWFVPGRQRQCSGQAAIQYIVDFAPCTPVNPQTLGPEGRLKAGVNTVADNSARFQAAQPAGDGRLCLRVPLTEPEIQQLVLLRPDVSEIKDPRQAETRHDPVAVCGDGDAQGHLLVIVSRHALLFSKMRANEGRSSHLRKNPEKTYVYNCDATAGRVSSVVSEVLQMQR